MRRLISLSVLFALLAVSELLYAQPFPVPQGTMCSECGMMVNPDSKFSVELVTTNGKKMFFCDIGDMLRHFRSDRGTLKTIYVKDHMSGGWIEGEKALYVLNKRFSTPMSWNIAAFSSESEAKKWGSTVGFSGAFGLVK